MTAREVIGLCVSRLRHETVLLVLAAAFGILIVRMVLSLVLIPPWQQPDEPAQVAIAEVSRSRLLLLDSSDPGREGEILRSMAKYDWWGHYGTKAPTPMPAKFVYAGATLGMDPTTNIPRTYYKVVAGILSLASPLSVAEDLYVMRAFSAAFALLTLWVAWRGARGYLGEAGGATVAVLLALHPQFAIVSTSASPDGLVNFLGACLWWQATRCERSASVLWPLAGMWLAAICAAAADRMGVPLLVSAFAASVFVMMRHARFQRSKIVVSILAATSLAVSLLLVDVIWHTFRAEMWDRVLPVPEAQRLDFFYRFTSGVFQSWWASLGWGRYVPPMWWMIVAFVVTAIAVVGVTRRFLQDHASRMRPALTLALAMIAVQAAAVYWAYFRLGYGAQGRHLFPCLIPTLVVLWVGVEAWAPMRYRQHAAIALVAVFALMDWAVWGLVAIPAYTT